jgi:small conductance mechanosensitive channel
MRRFILLVLGLVMASMLAPVLPPAFAQTTEAVSGQAAPSQDPTPTLTEAGEIDIDALAREFDLPSHILNPRIDAGRLELLLLPLTEPQLASASEAWQRIVQEQTQDVVNATLRISEMEGETADLFRERVAQLADERRHMFDNFTIVLNGWQKKGGDADQIAKYRAYHSSIIIDEIRNADVETLRQRSLKWLTARDGGMEVAMDVAIILGSLVGLVFLARLIRAVTRRWMNRVNRMSSLLASFLGGVFYWLTLAFGLMVVLSMLGVDVTPLFALVGGVSFILAFAMQETIANFFSGLMIMINKPFDEGDYVDLEGVTAGTVRQTNLISTTIATVDNKIVAVPNNRVWNSIITNVTASTTRRVDMVFGISYSDDIGHAIGLLEELVAAHPLALDAPEPVVCVGELAESSVNLICRPWAKTVDYWALFWDMQRLVKERFDAEGISIPFPQRSVHLEQSGALSDGTVPALIGDTAKTAETAPDHP